MTVPTRTSATPARDFKRGEVVSGCSPWDLHDQRVQDADAMTGVGKAASERRADEAGPTGDEDVFSHAGCSYRGSV